MTDFPKDLAAVVQRTVIRGELPALVVVHDDEDDWLIGDGVNDPNMPDACGIYHVAHIAEIDPTISELAVMPAGRIARRDSAQDAWRISAWSYADE